MTSFPSISPSTLAAILPLIVAAAAKTDLAGCTSTTIGNSIQYYVPDTGEICSIIGDCGGDRAGPPRKDVPGCPAYTGTATVTPSYISLATPSMAPAVDQTSVMMYAIWTTRSPSEKAAASASAASASSSTTTTVPSEYAQQPTSSAAASVSTIPQGYSQLPVSNTSSTTTTIQSLPPVIFTAAPITAPAPYAAGNGTLSLIVTGTTTIPVSPSESASSSPIAQASSGASAIFVSGAAVLAGLAAAMAML